MKILIIDDDPDDTAIFCEVLQELMPESECVIENNCTNIESTFAQFDHPPQIIFIDGHMYPVDGKSCLAKVKSHINNSESSIIVYSGSLSLGQIEEFKNMGADEVMIKANNYESLRQYLAKVLARYAT